MLDVDSLVTGYGKARAVNGVSLSVARGSVFAVIGPNGAGKTTLMRAICGDLPLWSGDILLDGESQKGLGSDERAMRGITLCPEGRRILSTLSVEENLRIGATPLARRQPRSQRKRTVSEGLERAYERFPVLRERRHALGGALSGGQQQMLAIARSLMSSPTLLLLDEPSLGLAPLIIEEVYRFLATLREEGLTLVLVEESAARALQFADHALVMKNGRTLLEGSAEEVRVNPRLAEAFLGEISEASL
ncbi:MAG TPA: ABC transporter ATP-binding protein [Actinomycetota bacterium]|nr:ABC transporter ATP-binding protein [Actinomycetota bacterium]